MKICGDLYEFICVLFNVIRAFVVVPTRELAQQAGECDRLW